MFRREINIFSWKMTFFQGGWEKDETMEEAALRETIEEAGVLGIVDVSICKISVLQSFFFLVKSFRVLI